MGIMELGAIGELVGGVAVVASLIYVGLQVRQSNNLARGAAELEVGRMNMDYYRLLSEGDAGALYTRCYFTPEAVGHDEHARFICRQGMWLHSIQAMYRQHQRGLLPESSWNPLMLSLANVLEDIPFLAKAWESNAFFLADDFRGFVDRLRPGVEKSSFWRVPESLRPDGS